MKMKINFLLVLFFGITTISLAQGIKKPVANKKPNSAVKNTVNPPVNEGIFVEFNTTKGKILVQLEYKKTPITVANFITLIEGNNNFLTDATRKGKPFYDGLKFHRVIKDFMIQGGDPAGNGSGGCGYSFKDEFTDLKHDKGGILSMANSGPSTNSSQFFITHKETPWLDGKHTVFGHVVSGMNVVNLIAQDDVMNKLTVIRTGTEAKKFNALKVLSDYFANKVEDDKKLAATQAEAQAKKAVLEAEAKVKYQETYGQIIAQKASALATQKTTATKTASGLQFSIIQKGTGKKPVDGATIYIHYAGYLEDGTLFDSSVEEVNKACGKYDQNRASQNGYQPFPFQYGKKDGLIPGFIEGLENMTIGDKAVVFIPSNLAYGERGAGGVIPPNSNIIFEIELLESIPTPKQ
jgi:cyclophilin family peptidyl-prolyl cis-trans isomerase